MGKNSQICLNDEKKLVLYAIGAVDNSPLISRIKIQKLMFLISNVFKDFQGLLHFEPHLFGPYSETLDNVLESLIRLGFVESIGSNFRLTSAGLKANSSLTPKPELARVIDDFKRFLNDLNDEEVLAFIYASYPKYISESVKWDELKPRRKDFAISLFRKNKVSFGKAAEIAGLNPMEFDILLKNKNIRWREIQMTNDLERSATFV
jgi:predicted HTH domain antitoxin